MANVDDRIQTCDSIPGTLRWSDLPDPAQGRPQSINSRLAINIDKEVNLVKLMTASGYK